MGRIVGLIFHNGEWVNAQTVDAQNQDMVQPSVAPVPPTKGGQVAGDVDLKPDVSAQGEAHADAGDMDEEEGAAFTCPVCGKSYKTEGGLAKHIGKEHA